MPVTPLELAKIAATAADDKKAYDIVLLDLSEKSDICDYFLICTVNSNPQMDAVVDEIREKVRANCGESPLSTEGRARATWVVLDYGAVVCHVFRQESRDFYRLERLWGDAPRVKLGLEGESAEAPWAQDAAASEEDAAGEDGAE